MSREHNHSKKYGREWKRLRDKYIKQHPLCERCGAIATEVHHIVPIIEGGKNHSIDNLMSVCESCHKEIHREMENDK